MAGSLMIDSPFLPPTRHDAEAQVVDADVDLAQRVNAPESTAVEGGLAEANKAGSLPRRNQFIAG